MFDRRRQVIDEEIARLETDKATFAKVQIGAMIEIPSAVLTAEKIAERGRLF